MTVVVGTAGHIDHGKTTLLQALTGIDADRLPEEQRRGMTIDVGYAHLAYDDGRSLDFVDVPGHDRLVGNMLVGAGEIDAALLVVAADDGPRAQTIEHLELLDALGIADAIVAVTKADLLEPDDPRRQEVQASVRSLLSPTELAGAPVLLVSARTGEGLAALLEALGSLAGRLESLAGGLRSPASPRARLAIDRVFAVKGRGAVVTGSLRGGRVDTDARLRVEPGGASVRVREIQVHGRPVPVAGPGRTALNLAGIDVGSLRRGIVVTDDPGVRSTDRLVVALRRPPPFSIAPSSERSARRAVPAAWPPGGPLRLHVGTEQVEARLDRSTRWSVETDDGERLASLRLGHPVAAAVGDRFVLRLPSPAATFAGGRVLDIRPPLGPSRRRATPERLLALAAKGGPTRAAKVPADAVSPPGSPAVAGPPQASPDLPAPPQASPAVAGPSPDAVLDLHGVLPLDRWQAIGGSGRPPVGPLVLATDVFVGLLEAALGDVAAHHAAAPDSAGLPVPELRRAVARELRRRAAVASPDAGAAAGALVDGLVSAGRLARSGDRIRDPERAEALPAPLVAAMDRLEHLLATPAPPSFTAAVREAGCPAEGVRGLEASGRIVRLAPDLAFAASTYRDLEALALRMADAGPLTPAAFRDATGTSRRFVLAILEDLDRRGILVRTAAGHVRRVGA